MEVASRISAHAGHYSTLYMYMYMYIEKPQYYVFCHVHVYNIIHMCCCRCAIFMR